MWFPVRGALLLSILFAALGSATLQLSAQAVAPASAENSPETSRGTSTETRRRASGIGIADPKLAGRVEAVLPGSTLEEKNREMVQYSAGHATRPGTGRT